jgi:hypothetical protein
MLCARTERVKRMCTRIRRNVENADGQSVLLFFQVIQAVIQLVNGNTNGTFFVWVWRALGFAPLYFLSYFWSCDLFYTCRRQEPRLYARVL